MKKLLPLLVIACMLFTLVSCSDADVASQNLSTAADNFQVTRRITGEYILTIEGLCSLGNSDAAGSLSVTCKTGDHDFKKHYLGLSDNVTYFAEQIDSIYTDTYHYKVIFKPATILPDIDVK